MKILIADDDRELGEILNFALTRAGFEVVAATDGVQALEMFEAEQPALVLLDWSMPGMDGLEVCRRLRERSTVLVIMLTVRNQEEDVLRAFEAGADDHVAKPFSPKQLVARIRAALRRAGPPATGELASGNLKLDQIRHALIRPDVGAISLTPLEFRLLHVLAQNRDQVMSPDAIIEQVWGHDDPVGGRTLLKGLVRRVRQKVDVDPAQPSLIKTVAGVGYLFSS
jgi:DNA-binding response OmpR family regulator